MFPTAGDREVTVEEQLTFERKGHVCIRGILRAEEVGVRFRAYDVGLGFVG